MLNVRQGHIGLDLSSRPATQCPRPLHANALMLRTRPLPITVSACAARLVRALSHPIVGNIDCDQTRLLLIVERGVERLYRGPHGIEPRHESSQSLLECIKPGGQRSRNFSGARRRENIRCISRGILHPLERISLALVRADDLRKIIKWPILQLDSLLAAATNQLVHCRNETGASAGERAGAGSGRSARLVSIAHRILIEVSIIIAPSARLGV